MKRFLVLIICALAAFLFLAVLPAHAAKTFTIKHFQGSAWNYSGVVNALKNAKRGERINIILWHNYGGYNHTREYVDYYVRNSKATVYIQVVGYAGSNGALFIRMGDYAIIPKSAIIMYHQSYITGAKGKAAYPRDLYRWSVRNHSMVGAFVFMTKNERRMWERRQDVYLKGARLCNSRYLVKDYGSYCVIKGIK